MSNLRSRLHNRRILLFKNFGSRLFNVPLICHTECPSRLCWRLPRTAGHPRLLVLRQPLGKLCSPWAPVSFSSPSLSHRGRQDTLIPPARGEPGSPPTPPLGPCLLFPNCTLKPLAVRRARHWRRHASRVWIHRQKPRPLKRTRSPNSLWRCSKCKRGKYFQILPLVPYLVVPRSVAQHLSTLKTRCFALSCKYSSFWKKFHIYTLTQVNQCQASE